MNKRGSGLVIGIIVAVILLGGTGAYLYFNNDSESDIPYYFIAIHNEPYYGPNAKGNVEQAYPSLQKMVVAADEYNIKLTIMLSPNWADYIYSSSERMAELDEWKQNGHEIAAHHHGVFHGNWDGYSGYSEDESLALRKTKVKNVESYIGDLSDYISKIKQINPDINSGCTNEEETKIELPDEIIYGTCSGFSNHLEVGTRERDGTDSEKGINDYVLTGIYNGIRRYWLSHHQVANHEESAEQVFESLNNNEVYGAILHSDFEYNQFITYINFLHSQDPEGKNSMTVSEIIQQKILPEKQISSELLEKVYESPIPANRTGRCGDYICDSLETANPKLCPADCG